MRRALAINHPTFVLNDEPRVLQRRRALLREPAWYGRAVEGVVMGWCEPPADETVGGARRVKLCSEAQWERARGEGAERDLVGWGQDG